LLAPSQSPLCRRTSSDDPHPRPRTDAPAGSLNRLCVGALLLNHHHISPGGVARQMRLNRFYIGAPLRLLSRAQGVERALESQSPLCRRTSSDTNTFAYTSPISRSQSPLCRRTSSDVVFAQTANFEKLLSQSPLCRRTSSDFTIVPLNRREGKVSIASVSAHFF